VAGPRARQWNGLRVRNGPALTGHAAQAVRDAIAATVTASPGPLRQTLTWDGGKEMAQHSQRLIPCYSESSRTAVTAREQAKLFRNHPE